MNTINIQNVGQVEATAASAMKAGDVVMFNFGITAQIENVEEASAKFVAVRFSNGSAARYAKTKMMAVVA